MIIGMRKTSLQFGSTLQDSSNFDDYILSPELIFAKNLAAIYCYGRSNLGSKTRYISVLANIQFHLPYFTLYL